jgi:glucose/arabinose dehydrogenase
MHTTFSCRTENFYLKIWPGILRRTACTFAGLLLLSGLALAPARAATLPPNFTETLVTNALSNPTAMALAPDGRIFVCQQGGQLRVIENGALLAAPFVTLTVDANGERGLLGVAFDPNFAANQFIYVYYTATTPQIHNRVSRFTANGNTALAGSEVSILDLNNLSGATNHNGGAIHFGPDGKLYIAVGENANPANSQSLANLLGKLLRINSDGTIPADNPSTFPGIAGSSSGINRAIWSVGLRNPYTFKFQSGTGRLFINDVGQNTWEEINDGIAGTNYGWSICEGICTPSNANFRDPSFQYAHTGGSAGTTGCAITGGDFYNPTTVLFPSAYVGKYFFADFCNGWIRRFDLVTSTATDFASGISSPVDLMVTPDGRLYYLARGSGSLFRIQYNAPTASSSEISGRIITSDGSPLEGVTVNLGGGQMRKTITDAQGRYVFTNVDNTSVQTVTPARANYSFSPGSRFFSQPGIHADATFMATTNGESENPLDTPDYFVRQQYVDILGREPDEGGFTYWSEEIILCGTNAACVNARRREVAAAFFIEQEFQQTGSFVYNLYASALGRQPRFVEYGPDRKLVIGGENLAVRKQSFAESFVQRAEFVEKYQANVTAESFVDALIANVRATMAVDLSGDRGSLLAAYNNGANLATSRSLAVRELAEHGSVQAATYNSAFVLTEYFGYLRRDPDPGGYEFWLDVLANREPGNYRGMVCSFITSTEYQRRFGAIVTHGNAECGR